jgi:very-short-patch-repair endonuclease
MTEAEEILWGKLRNRKVFKIRFRRQHPISIFVVDFYCHELKLVIEIDGGIHLNNEVAEYDDGREYDIEKYGIKILRFSNEQIFKNLDFVINEILQTVYELEPPKEFKNSHPK